MPNRWRPWPPRTSRSTHPWSIVVLYQSCGLVEGKAMCKVYCTDRNSSDNLPVHPHFIYFISVCFWVYTRRKKEFLWCTLDNPHRYEPWGGQDRLPEGNISMANVWLGLLRGETDDGPQLPRPSPDCHQQAGCLPHSPHHKGLSSC